MGIPFQCTSLVISLLTTLGTGQTLGADLAETGAANIRAPLRQEEVVTRMVEMNRQRAQALAAYRGVRVYRLDYRGFPGSRSAEMAVDMKYESPGTKEFTIRSQTGSKLLIDRVLKKLLQSEKEALGEENQKRVALNTDNYHFTLVGYESTPGGSFYILAAEPLTSNKFLYRGKIWVDAEDFAVMRVEAVPAKNPSFWTKETRIEQVYSKVDGFWLPLVNRSTSTIRLGGQASLTIEYQSYEITAALPLAHGTTPGGHP
jgi:hypothetical protein